jgi:hypothetical protein
MLDKVPKSCVGTLSLRNHLNLLSNTQFTQSLFVCLRIKMTLVNEMSVKVKNILSKLNSMKSSSPTLEQVSKIQDELHSIDEKIRDGVVVEADGSISPGQGDLSDDLNDAHDIIADLLETLEE